MPSLQGHGTQKNSSIHASVLNYVQLSNTLSMFLLNFLGSVCYFGCLFCLCMSTSSHVSGVLNIVVLSSMRMVSVWLVVNYDSVTSVDNDY